MLLGHCAERLASPLGRCRAVDSAFVEVHRTTTSGSVTALAFVGDELVFAVDDGMIQRWALDEFSPRPEGALAPTPGRVVVALSGRDGRLTLGDDAGTVWTIVDGQLELGPRALTPDALRFVASSAAGGFTVGGTSAFTGTLRSFAWSTQTLDAATTTDLWTAEAAAVDDTGRWFTVGEWYGCLALERRATTDAAAPLDAWDGCRFGSVPMRGGRFLALDVEPGAARVWAAGTASIAVFDAEALASGPRSFATSDATYVDVHGLVEDGLVVAAGVLGADAVVDVFDESTLHLERRHVLPTATRAVLDEEGGHVATADAAGTVRVYRCVTP